MATGQLLVLVGEECKRKELYLGLDKAYEFSVLLGIGSDTHDVLGRLYTDTNETHPAMPVSPSGLRPKTGGRLGDTGLTSSPAEKESKAIKMPSPTLSAQRAFLSPSILENEIRPICAKLTGQISLPYPAYSSKTVNGKPLFQWALENRLHEITIPERQSTIYSLEYVGSDKLDRATIAETALANINTMPPVTDDRKVLGADFRRTDVRTDWEQVRDDTWSDTLLPATYSILHFRCSCSSGTYMRTLACVIAMQLSTVGLAWRIHRVKIGTFDTATQRWSKEPI
jgi:tRNA U55 pseudouridine synthase TruB